ncbi:MAG: C25 family cysteine peptidase [Candidatus Cloacimonetes bacterium]|nr:C25 family cysteine peptidase [Candidatus Cloacimonadota bacterium]
MILFLGAAHAHTSYLQKVSSSAAGINLRLQSPNLQIETQTLQGEQFQRLYLDGASSSAETGAPDLPLYSATVILPPTGSYSLQVVHKNQKVYQNIQPYPVQSKEDESDYLPQRYADFSQSAQVAAAPISVMRDFRVLQLSISPLGWDANRGELVHCTDMEIEIRFNNDPGPNEVPAYQSYSPAFREIYEANLINFNDYRDLNTALDGGRILLIHWNNTNSTFQSLLNNFITWKRQKGHEVFAVSSQVAGSSNTAIKNYIQNRYNNLDTRPDFIILVGDVSSIPTWIENISGYSGVGDYPYTYLAGNDNLGDAMIGRISVDTVEHMAVMMSKTYRYERDIFLEDGAADWLNRILLIGDPSTSGISCVYTSKYIKELAETVNPDYQFIENYIGGFPSTINSGINQGVGFFSYRGYINMSGWNPGSSLVNNPRFPHAVILTCGTGNFSGTSTTEEFTRLGTAANPAGAVTAIGMATSGTHTMFNNNLVAAIYNGIFSHKMRSMGEALLNGRLYLNEVYASSHPNQANYFAHWCNLIGDPSMEVFVGIPEAINLAVPQSLPLGSLILDATVSDNSGNPIEGVCVTAYRSSLDSIEATAYTDEYGNVSLQIPGGINESLLITASKHDHKPAQTTVAVADGGLVANNTSYYDNGMHGSVGDGDGIARAGESIAVIVNVRNTSDVSLTGLSGTVTSSDPLVSLGSTAITFPDLAPNSNVDADSAIMVQIDHTLPAQHDIRLELSINDEAGNTHSFPVHVTAFNAVMEVETLYLTAGGDGILDPTENGTLQIAFRNISVVPAHDLHVQLISMNDLVVINQAQSYLGEIAANNLATTDQLFELFARSILIPGMQIPFKLRLYNSDGFEQITSFNLSIGVVNQNTPLGPDSYGYFIYDQTDLAFSDCPSYEWIEINPNQGGQGTRLTTLSDTGIYGDEGDQQNSHALEVVDLPFSFNFYGVPYTQITVCVNGFIVLGITEDGEFRNSRLPGGLGPSPMIAAFWDDLIQIEDGGVYKYYDQAEHTFIIEYYKLRNGKDRSSLETFQVIFYDPVFHPTSMGDGMIKIQYKDFNNIDVGGGGYTPLHGNFCTIGIKDHTNTRGLEYTFNNSYPQAAAPLSSNKALMITTVPVLHQTPYLIVQDLMLSDANANGYLEPGETAELGVRLINQGLNEATGVQIELQMSNPYAQILDPQSNYPDIPGDSGAVNSFPILISISPDCPDGTVISMLVHVTCEGGEWTYPLTMQVQKPDIHIAEYYINDSAFNGNGLAEPGETIKLVVNYANSSPLDAINITSSIFCLSELVSISNPEILLPKVASGALTQAVYEITISESASVGNNLTFFITYLGEQVVPQNEQLLISLGTTGMFEDFETTNGGFVPSPSMNGWQWGVSSNVSAHSGTKVWGTRLNEAYPNNVVYTLTTQPVYVGSSFMLEFWHYYDAESTYDGGNVSASVDGGQTWNLLNPENGYPQSSVSALTGPGYSGQSAGWIYARFPLANYANQSVSFRFKFASDNYENGQGWFIDDVRTTGYIPYAGKISGNILSSDTEIAFTEVLVKSGSGTHCYPDATGYYELFLPLGSYQVNAESEGYYNLDPISIEISSANPEHEADFYLGYLNGISEFQITSFDAERGIVHLGWVDIQDSEYTLISYDVYRRSGGSAFELIGVLPADAERFHCYDELPNLGQYQYYVKCHYAEGNSRPSETLTIDWGSVSTPDSPELPSQTALQANYPNPFNPSTTIAFSLAEPAVVKLSVFNLRGQKVKTLTHQMMNRGNHNIVWNGDDDSGRSVSSGIYLIRMETAGSSFTRKAMLMK